MQPAESSIRLGGQRGGNILEFYTQEFRPESSTGELFKQHVIQWFFAAKHLRKFEANNLTDNPTVEDLASHRMICLALITFGEFAAQFARKEKKTADLEVVGLSVECIEAETRLLRSNFKMFHDDTMTFKEADSLLAEAFHET